MWPTINQDAMNCVDTWNFKGIRKDLAVYVFVLAFVAASAGATM